MRKTMMPSSSVAGAALLLLALPAMAQQGPPQGDPHHPGEAAAITAQAAPPGAPPPSPAPGATAPGGGASAAPGAPGPAPGGAGPMGGGPGVIMGGPGATMGRPGMGPGMMGMSDEGEHRRRMMMMMHHHRAGDAPMNVIINVGPGIRVEVEDDDERGGRRRPMRMGPPGGAGMVAPGLMGGDIGPMGPRMMGPRAAMRPLERIEGQLAYYRAELGITEAQMPQWNAFADAMRAAAARLRQAYAAQATQAAGQPTTAPEQLERRIALLSVLLETTRSAAEAARPLYAALSEEQKRTADALMAEHLRAMRMHGP